MLHIVVIRVVEVDSVSSGFSNVSTFTVMVEVGWIEYLLEVGSGLSLFSPVGIKMWVLSRTCARRTFLVFPRSNSFKTCLLAAGSWISGSLWER